MPIRISGMSLRMVLIRLGFDTVSIQQPFALFRKTDFARKGMLRLRIISKVLNRRTDARVEPAKLLQRYDWQH